MFVMCPQYHTNGNNASPRLGGKTYGGCLLGVSWVPPGCLPGVSWVRLGCLLDTSWVPLGVSWYLWVSLG